MYVATYAAAPLSSSCTGGRPAPAAPVALPTARLTASARTKLRTGRVILHSFSINNRLAASQTIALQHMQTTQGLRILDESSLPIAGRVRCLIDYLLT